MDRHFSRTALIALLTLAPCAVAQDQGVKVDDIYIDHVSTVPANQGETVQLFARRYHTENADRGAVIMLSSDTLPTDAGLGLDFENYNHFRYLASLGFDVFAADNTGYGFSPKPMMDTPCNVGPEVQARPSVPNPHSERCEPTYPHPLTSLFSDWDEVDAFIAHVRELTGDDRVVLMGWSRSGPRAGGYAARHPEKVERLVLIGPGYNPDSPSESLDELPDGYPIHLGNVDSLVDSWSDMVQCEDWADFDGVRNQLKSQLNAFDPLAAEWGEEPGTLYRAPRYVGGAASLWPGWNRSVVQQIRTPTLVVRGLDDTLAQSDHILYEDLTVEDKIRVDFECGTHWAIWEGTREVVRDVIAEFLQSGTVNGQSSGVLLVDREGEFEDAFSGTN